MTAKCACLPSTYKSKIFTHSAFFFLSTGIWKRKDRPQQQLQPIWKVHPGQLPRQRSGARVRNRSFRFHFMCAAARVTFVSSVRSLWPSVSDPCLWSSYQLPFALTHPAICRCVTAVTADVTLQSYASLPPSRCINTIKEPVDLTWFLHSRAALIAGWMHVLCLTFVVYCSFWETDTKLTV